MRGRHLTGLIILFVVVAPLDCRRATGIAVDPMDREARDALVSYLKIDTSNPPGNESQGARFLQQLLARDGIEAQLVGSDPRRQSLYARLRSGTSEKALLLLHHIDVVPAIAAEWTRPPFGGAESEGYVWGRGALDVKSLGVAQAMAVIELKRRHLHLKRDVILLAVADEEAGGLRGCNELLEKRPELFDNVGYVLNEGGYNETVVDRVTFWGIEVQQKVPLWLRLHAKGVAGHAASPPDDGGAVAKLVRALGAIESLPTPYRVVPDVENFFHAAGAARKDERGEMLRRIREDIGGQRLERVLPSAYRALLRDTIVVTQVEGGTSVNSIPANASAEVDIRLLPDERPDTMLQRVREAAGSQAEVETLLAGQPATASTAATDLFKVIAGLMRSDQPGSTVSPVVGAGATDSRFFRAKGIVAYGVAPFKVNYYDAGTAHGTDERIRARFFTDGVRLMRRIVTAYCAAGQ
jgi:acetylornithine deacetylase/succinyl-diaminopimelate desuccinylase-like protein